MDVGPPLPSCLPAMLTSLHSGDVIQHHTFCFLGITKFVRNIIIHVPIFRGDYL